MSLGGAAKGGGGMAARRPAALDPSAGPAGPPLQQFSFQLSPTAAQLHQVKRDFADGRISFEEKADLKDTILREVNEAATVLNVDDLSGGAGAAGLAWPESAMSPAAMQLKQVQGFFKDGRIDEKQKAAMKEGILRKSLTGSSSSS
eukprot:g6054.t1